MSQKIPLLTPVGRLVMGSLYEGKATDALGNPLTYKTGANQGQPRMDYYFAMAIKKGVETDWRTTEWGKLINQAALTGFPNGQTRSASFAWKVKDGDSDVINAAGRAPRDCEGFPGHWVLSFNSGFAPNIVNHDGSEALLQKNFVNLGDYIQVFGNVSDNGSAQQPGVFLNHQAVAFAGYGERIVMGIDTKTVGFGKAAMPAGVMSTPPAALAAPAVATPPPLPYTAILTPHTMTALAKDIPYDKYIEQGWTDALLIQHGYMLS